MPHDTPAHKRILIKLSGEALMGDDAFGINQAVIGRIVGEIAEVARMGVQVAVVIGGGNIFRGMAAPWAWIAPRPITWACWPP